MIFNLVHRGSLPKLSYPITRDYPGKYFHPVVYTISGFALVLLGAVAFATQGYELKSVLSSTYNQTQFHWFSHFLSPQQPGSLCDPHVFSIGDMFQTTQAIFPWSIDWTSAESSMDDTVQGGVSYADSPLGGDSCDVNRMKVTVDLTAWTAVVSATIQCDDVFPVSASTSWTASTIPDRASWNLARYCPQNPRESPNFLYASTILQPAGLDLLMALRQYMDPAETSNIITIAARVPRPVDKLDCSPKPLHPHLSTLGFSNLTFTNNTIATDTFNDLFFNATSNYMQAMLAAVRLDVGNRCPNFLTDLAYINQTFLETPTLTPETYQRYFQSDEALSESFYSFINRGEAFTFIEPYLTWISLPLNATDAVYVTAPYLCHLTVRKGALQLLVSVAVAMSGLFLSGWSMFQFFAPWFITHNSPKANHCIGHFELDLEAGSRSNNEKEPDPNHGLVTRSPDVNPSLIPPPSGHPDSESGTSHGSTAAPSLLINTSGNQKADEDHLGQVSSATTTGYALSPSETLKGSDEDGDYLKHPDAIKATAPVPTTFDVDVESRSTREMDGLASPLSVAEDAFNTATEMGTDESISVTLGEPPRLRDLSDGLDRSIEGVTKQGTMDEMGDIAAAEVHIESLLGATDHPEASHPARNHSWLASSSC
ncbi:hypothetical protein FRB94_000876 [Tulasnella sp. JGI-2019a]|nr:hypothetical protein FRB94_000876 [Tulasnella sp. JGI-2019a]KAG9015252.1 hypothetical protein FRB93_012951 [Tulasnella sp. JGI-2019a]